MEITVINIIYMISNIYLRYILQPNNFSVRVTSWLRFPASNSSDDQLCLLVEETVNIKSREWHCNFSGSHLCICKAGHFTEVTKGNKNMENPQRLLESVRNLRWVYVSHLLLTDCHFGVGWWGNLTDQELSETAGEHRPWPARLPQRTRFQHWAGLCLNKHKQTQYYNRKLSSPDFNL